MTAAMGDDARAVIGPCATVPDAAVPLSVYVEEPTVSFAPSDTLTAAP